MNFLGKVFVIIVLVLSICFMMLAVVVYTTHKNWRELVTGPNGLQAKLTQAQADMERLRSEYNRDREQLDAEKLAAQQQASKLETERTALAQTNVTIQEELDTLKQQQREQTAAIASTQKNNEDLTTQVTGLSQQKREAELARDAQYAQMLTATELRNQMVGQLEAAMQRNAQLTSQVANMTAVMRANGVDPGTDPNAVVQTVQGEVLAIRRAGGSQLVEVSIGSDDDIKPGQTLEVFRGGKYLGRLNVLESSPDKAVGQVDRRYLQGQIQEGDRVATRLSF
jgi:hypothetical protein